MNTAKRGALGLLLIPTIAGCGAGDAADRAGTARAATPPPAITSSLDGRAVLPQRVRWIARPTAPPAQVDDVQFLIDGTLRGTERGAPYNYGSDDFHGHLGWLVTSWLKPGPHRFTVRARLRGGRTASNTVVAAVRPAPSRPAALGRHWRRDVTRDEVGANGPPAGAWTLVIDRVAAWTLDPKGSGIAEHVVAGRRTLRIDAGLWTTPYVDGHAAPGSQPLNGFGHHDLGAFFCREDGPPASYRWSASGGRLRLTAVDEPCADRRAIWEGTWRQAS